MLYVHVQGGTNAGRRKAKSLPYNWFCSKCEQVVAGHWARCPNDSQERPHV